MGTIANQSGLRHSDLRRHEGSFWPAQFSANSVTLHAATFGYLAGGINTGSFGYSNTNPVVGQTTAYDPTDNKYYERALHSEARSFLYQPVDNSGNVASPTPGYDSIDRLLQYQRGTLSASGGYQNAGGGSISSANTLPGANASQNWNLDGLGNWRASNYTPVGSGNGQDQRSHNRLNQITQRTVFGQGGPVNFNYDGRPGQSNGNLISDGTRIYASDAFNRLIQVNRASDGAIIAQYFYDAIGRRVRKITTNGGLTGTVPNETTDYFYFGNQCMEEREVGTGSGSGTESPARQYVWGTYIDECIQLTTLTYLGEQALPPGQYYLLQDTLYRAVALTNSGGAIVEAYDTDAYGNTIIYSEPGSDGVWFTNDDLQAPYGANEAIYCGYRYDAETQNYFARARYYAPPLGRWLSRDPIGYSGGVNLYGYAGGSPAIQGDPSGASAVPQPLGPAPLMGWNFPPGGPPLPDLITPELRFRLPPWRDWPGGSAPPPLMVEYTHCSESPCERAKRELQNLRYHRWMDRRWARAWGSIVSQDPPEWRAFAENTAAQYTNRVLMDSWHILGAIQNAQAACRLPNSKQYAPSRITPSYECVPPAVEILGGSVELWTDWFLSNYWMLFVAAGA